MYFWHNQKYFWKIHVFDFNSGHPSSCFRRRNKLDEIGKDKKIDGRWMLSNCGNETTQEKYWSKIRGSRSRPRYCKLFSAFKKIYMLLISKYSHINFILYFLKYFSISRKTFGKECWNFSKPLSLVLWFPINRMTKKALVQYFKC